MFISYYCAFVYPENKKGDLSINAGQSLPVYIFFNTDEINFADPPFVFINQH